MIGGVVKLLKELLLDVDGRHLLRMSMSVAIISWAFLWVYYSDLNFNLASRYIYISINFRTNLIKF